MNVCSQVLLDHGGISDRRVSTVQEGSEPEAFWSALGGMAEYPKVSEGEPVTQEPRLFQVMCLLSGFSRCSYP